MIEQILNKIELEDLISAVGSEKLTQIKNLIIEGDAELTKEDVINYIISLYGYDLLSEKRIRQLIFYTIEFEKLQILSHKYCKKNYPKAYDISLELSILPWKYGSDFVNEVSDILGLPQLYLPLETDNFPSTFKINPFSVYYPLHNYQDNLKDKIVNELLSDNNKFLIQMPTGAGKTRTVLQSIIQYSQIIKLIEEGKSILWLAHTEELCEQAISTFSNLWPHLSQDSITVHRCYANHSISLVDDKGSFIVGTLQKLSSMLHTDSYFLHTLKSKLKVIVVDEAHKSVAKTYAKSIGFLLKDSDCKLIGATATPGRNNSNIKANLELADFFNGKLLSPSFSENPIAELRNIGVLSFLQHKIIDSRIDVYFNEMESNAIKNSGEFSNITLKKISENIERNKLIIEIIEKEIIKKNPCLVFTCSVEHAQILNAALNYKKYSSLSLDSNTSKQRRKIIIDQFKNGSCQVLFNFGILSTGFDAPNVRTIIITRPTSSVVLYSQMIGRGLRGPKMGGSKECNLIDIKDNFKNFGGVEEVYEFFEEYWN